MSLKKIVLSVAIVALVAGLGLTLAKADDKDAPAAAEKTAGLSKADVEKIVHDYIVANPKLIMDSVDDYQQRAMTEQSTEGLKKNQETLYKDPASPEAGNPKGDVTVVEFFDYNCHFCKGAFPSIQTLLEKDKNVRVVFKELPILGQSSITAAKWALAADKQHKYYAFHSAMMENKDPISDDLLESVAKKVGMDVDKAKGYVSSSDAMVQLQKNHTLAADLGISGTPGFIIGDNISRGAIPLEDMQKMIADLRAAAPKKD